LACPLKEHGIIIVAAAQVNNGKPMRQKNSVKKASDTPAAPNHAIVSMQKKDNVDS
jgi:hypothetical protein